MKLPKLTKWDKLEITWQDASVDNCVTDSAKFLRELKPCIRRTLGYYIGTKNNCVCINTIPLGMILALKVLQ